MPSDCENVASAPITLISKQINADPINHIVMIHPADFQFPHIEMAENSSTINSGPCKCDDGSSRGVERVREIQQQ
jgi:hypothetical protein